jgi:hypothetical protein
VLLPFLRCVEVKSGRVTPASRPPESESRHAEARSAAAEAGYVETEVRFDESESHFVGHNRVQAGSNRAVVVTSYRASEERNVHSSTYGLAMLAIARRCSMRGESMATYESLKASRSTIFTILMEAFVGGEGCDCAREPGHALFYLGDAVGQRASLLAAGASTGEGVLRRVEPLSQTTDDTASVGALELTKPAPSCGRVDPPSSGEVFCEDGPVGHVPPLCATYADSAARRRVKSWATCDGPSESLCRRRGP